MKTTKKLLSIILVTALMLTLMPLTAQTAYAAAPKVKITWNANGGKIGTAKKKTVSYTKGKKIGKLQTAKRTGYTLKGWYTKTSGGTKIKTTTKATKKATYYAQWTAKKYTLTFNANGGSVTPASKKVAYKKGYGTLPTPKRSGYSFNGWYTAKSSGARVSATTKMAAKNVTVYAQWKKASRVLNEYEKALVGQYYQGDFDFNASGFWMYAGQDANYSYEKWVEGASYGQAYVFDADGTFVRFTCGAGSYTSTGYTIVNGNWSVTANGTVRISNVLVSYTDLKDSSNSYKNEKASDRYYYYVFTTEEGKKWLKISDDSLEAAKSGTDWWYYFNIR